MFNNIMIAVGFALVTSPLIALAFGGDVAVYWLMLCVIVGVVTLALARK